MGHFYLSKNDQASRTRTGAGRRAARSPAVIVVLLLLLLLSPLRLLLLPVLVLPILVPIGPRGVVVRLRLLLVVRARLVVLVCSVPMFVITFILAVG